MYFLGSIHPPPTPRTELLLLQKPGFFLEKHKLEHVTTHSRGLPVTIQHSGIKKAVEDGAAAEGGVYAPSQEAVVRNLKALEKAGNHKHAIIGKVVDVFEGKSGGYYTNFKMKNSLKSLSWLVTRGHVTGLSLTTMYPGSWDGVAVPYEVSLCIRPERPHTYIVTASKDPVVVFAYKRCLQTGRVTWKPRRAFRKRVGPVSPGLCWQVESDPHNRSVNVCDECRRRLDDYFLGSTPEKIAEKIDGVVNGDGKFWVVNDTQIMFEDRPLAVCCVGPIAADDTLWAFIECDEVQEDYEVGTTTAYTSDALIRNRGAGRG